MPGGSPGLQMDSEDIPGPSTSHPGHPQSHVVQLNNPDSVVNDQPHSPLDDYLRDEDDAEATEHADNSISSSRSLADELLRLSSAREPHFTSLPTSATSSRPFPRSSSSSQSSHTLQSPVDTTRQDACEEPASARYDFAERFKYLVCSSGLLERGYVPGMSGAAAAAEAPSDQCGSILATSPDPITSDETIGVSDVANVLVQRGLELARQRTDIAAASAVLVVALGTAMSMARIVAVSVIMLVLVIAAGVLIKARHAVSHPHPLPTSVEITPDPALEPTQSPRNPQSSTLDSLSSFLAASRRLDTATDASLALLTPHPDTIDSHHPLRVALHRLTDEVTDHIAAATSEMLAVADKKELAVLGEMYDIPVVNSFFYARQPPRSFDDEAGENGDVAGDKIHAQPEAHSSPPKPTQPITPSQFHSYPRRVHSSHSHHLSLMSSSSPVFDPDDRFTKVPPRTPRLSKRASWSSERCAPGSAGTPHCPLGGSPVPGSGGKGSRARAHARERRITEADEDDAEMDPDESVLSTESTSTSSGDSTGSFPKSVPDQFSPTLGRRGSKDRVVVPESTPHFYPKPLLTPQTQHRHLFESNLQQRSKDTSLTEPRLSSTVPLTLATSANRLHRPSLLDMPTSTEHIDMARSATSLSATTPGAKKRRSLLGMPYYTDQMAPVTALSTGALNLARTRSLPVSNLQHLRSQSATGGGAARPLPFASSTRSPIVTDMPLPKPTVGLGLPPMPRSTRPRRTPSISPLTLAGLKASYLGLHLKRRRLACCLLGLKFDESPKAVPDDTYWSDVGDALDRLTVAMRDEAVRLDGARADVEREMAAAKVLEELAADVASLVTPFSPVVDTVLGNGLGVHLGGSQNFAPRDSPTARVLGSVVAVQQSLARAWTVTEGVRRAMEAGPTQSGEVALGPAGLGSQWATLRDEVGTLLREYERGREAIMRVGKGESESSEGGSDVDHSEVPARDEKQILLPGFIQRWRGDEGPGPQTFASPEMIDEAEAPATEVLPPPGVDEVFESISGTGPVRGGPGAAILSSMTRDERVRLTRRAREKGVSVYELAAEGADGAGSDGHREKEMRVAGGEVVHELKGMIGMIRQRKEGRGQMTGEDGAKVNGVSDSDRPGAYPARVTRVLGFEPVKSSPLVSPRDEAGNSGSAPVQGQNVRDMFVFPPRPATSS